MIKKKKKRQILKNFIFLVQLNIIIFGRERFIHFSQFCILSGVSVKLRVVEKLVKSSLNASLYSIFN